MEEKRLTIFCFYDVEGIVGKDVGDILGQLSFVSERIIIVVNGFILDTEKERLKNYSQEIIVRKNEGMDQGAYRDILNDYLKYEDIEQYDDLIFCNNSFYGFFIPLERIFENMKEKSADMWGLNIIDRRLIKHIQSYFLVFSGEGKRAVYEYFQNAKYVRNYGEAVAFMEPGLFKYFEKRELKYASYTDVNCNDVYSNPLECIEKYNLPIIKKKCFDEKYCNPIILESAKKYIRRNGYKYYLPELKSGKKNSIKPKQLAVAQISEKELLEWANEGEFYIFGAGIMGNLLYYTYFEYNKNFVGFVVSGKKEQMENCFSLSEISDTARIIIGVNQDLQEEVNSLLPETMEKLVLWKI